MKSKRIKSYLAENSPESLVLPPEFDEALLGVGTRCGKQDLAIYDSEKIISLLASDMSEEEAVEYFEFNILGAWMGEGTPIFMSTVDYYE